MALPKFLQPYLASYDLTSLEVDAPAVKKELITQILNSGDDKAIRWLFRSFPLKEVKTIIRSPQRGTWFRNSLNYWTKIFGIHLSKPIYQKAILELTPTNNVSKSSE